MVAFSQFDHERRPWREKLSLISSKCAYLMGEGYVHFKGTSGYEAGVIVDTTSVSLLSLHLWLQGKEGEAVHPRLQQRHHYSLPIPRPGWKKKASKGIQVSALKALVERDRKHATTWTRLFYQDMSFEGNKWRNRVNGQVRVNLVSPVKQWRGKFCQKCHSS